RRVEDRDVDQPRASRRRRRVRRGTRRTVLAAVDDFSGRATRTIRVVPLSARIRRDEIVHTVKGWPDHDSRFVTQVIANPDELVRAELDVVHVHVSAWL